MKICRLCMSQQRWDLKQWQVQWELVPFQFCDLADLLRGPPTGSMMTEVTDGIRAKKARPEGG